MNIIPRIKASHAGIIDTLSNPINNFELGFWITAEDSMSAYFEPPGACYIKAVGIVGNPWGNADADGYNLIINKAAYGWQFPDD